MRHWRIAIGIAVLAGVVGRADAAPVAGTCAVAEVFTYELTIINGPLPGPNPAGVVAAVTVDPDTGAFTLDGSSMSFPKYPFPFGLLPDTFAFGGTTFSGSIDAGGNVDLADVHYQFCTLDAPEVASQCDPPSSCVCVPSNVCSNDVTDPCVLGASAPCPGGGVCQGVCANAATTSCAGDGDCPGSRCGNGYLTPFANDFTTAISAKEDILVRGAPLDFGTGTFRIAAVGNTPEEAPVVGSSGTSAFFFACTLDPKPDPTALPPSRWVVGKGQAKLGKEGPGKTDDTLVLTGGIDPIAAFDPTTSSIVLTLAQSDPTLPSPELRAKRVLQLTIPGGGLTGRGKKLKLKDKGGNVVTTAPPSAATHTVVLRQQKAGGYKMKLVSKGLDLDAIGDQAEVLTSVRIGRENGSEPRAVSKKKSKLLF